MDFDRLSGAKRILVLGCAGAGKSTLARALSEKMELPHISMDRAFFWLPGWKLRDRVEVRHMIAQAVSEDRWIFDGNSSGTLDLRLPRADLIIWLRMPRALCLRRVIGRRFLYAGRSRPDMADGCPEKIDWEFLRYIWNFESKEAPEIMNEIAKHGSGVPIIELHTLDAVRALLAHAKMAV